jgi:hypothetical protein
MEYIKNSIFLKCLKKLGQVYLVIEEKVSSVYLSSLTHRLIAKTAESIKNGFRFSVFGRLTEINEDASRNFLQASKTTKIALDGMRNLNDRLIVFSTPSSLVTSIKSLKCDFFSKPLKVGGTIVITTITANLVLSIVLQRQITLWGGVMRGLLLFVGISGLFCNTDWSTLKTSSVLFKKGVSR